MPEAPGCCQLNTFCRLQADLCTYLGLWLHLVQMVVWYLYKGEMSGFPSKKKVVSHWLQPDITFVTSTPRHHKERQVHINFTIFYVSKQDKTSYKMSCAILRDILRSVKLYS